MPPVDEQRFKLWSASAPQRDAPDGTRYSFLCCERQGLVASACAACVPYPLRATDGCHADADKPAVWKAVAHELHACTTLTPTSGWHESQRTMPATPSRACCRHSRRAGGPAGAAAGGGQPARGDAGGSTVVLAASSSLKQGAVNVGLRSRRSSAWSAAGFGHAGSGWICMLLRGEKCLSHPLQACTLFHSLPSLQYLEMIDDVMRNGVFRGDRTGTGAQCPLGRG